MFKPANQEQTSSSDGKGCINRSSSAADVESTITRQDEGNRRVPGLLTKQALVQSSLYIASFFICYFPLFFIMIMRILRIPPPDWSFWWVSIFMPLGGFFNILIYIRPKVQRYKDSNPENSRLYVFLIIVLSGGEVPAEIDVGNIPNDFSILENSIKYRAYRAGYVDSMPSERVRGQDSCYMMGALEISSFAENSLSYSRNDEEHSYGIQVVIPVPVLAFPIPSLL
jgi:hypothetical protein